MSGHVRKYQVKRYPKVPSPSGRETETADSGNATKCQTSHKNTIFTYLPLRELSIPSPVMGLMHDTFSDKY